MTALSPERAGRITGSRIPRILGLSPYGDRASALREMVRQYFGATSEFEGNIATAFGNEHEDDAIASYEQMRGEMVYDGQAFFRHPLYDDLGVTVDGLVSYDGLLEAKCPFRGSYAHVDERPDFAAQIQLQLHCTGRAWGDLVVWRSNGIAVSRVEYDHDWLDSIADELDEFRADYRAAIVSEETAAEYLTPLVDQRSDGEWQLAALAYQEAVAAHNLTGDDVEETRAVLLKLADGKATRGAGVQVIVSNKRGTIDYKAATAALAVDFEPYRKAPKTVYTVRGASE